jgi:hypothetical protein
MWVRWVCTVRGDTKSRVAMSKSHDLAWMQLDLPGAAKPDDPPIGHQDHCVRIWRARGPLRSWSTRAHSVDRRGYLTHDLCGLVEAVQ